MQDYNDKNFMIADADTPERRAEIRKQKENLRDSLWAVFGLLLVWGITVIVATSRLM